MPRSSWSLHEPTKRSINSTSKSSMRPTHSEVWRRSWERSSTDIRSRKRQLRKPWSIISARRAGCFSRRQLELIGVVPDSPELTYCRTIDIQRHLNAEVMNAGEMESRRVKNDASSGAHRSQLAPHLCSWSNPGHTRGPQRRHSRRRDGGAEPDSYRRTDPDRRY